MRLEREQERDEREREREDQGSEIAALVQEIDRLVTSPFSCPPATPHPCQLIIPLSIPTFLPLAACELCCSRELQVTRGVFFPPDLDHI